MMKRPWHIAVLFGLAMAVVLAVMAWVSRTALRLDHAQGEARQQAALEENVRLALWRMDSAVAPLIAQESARPWTAYVAGAGPAPTGTQVLLHFQIAPGGGVQSPEVTPPGSKPAPGKPASGPAASPPTAEARPLKALESSLAGIDLASRLPPIASPPPAQAPGLEQVSIYLPVASGPAQQGTAQFDGQIPTAGQQVGQVAGPAQQQEDRNRREFQMRAQNYSQALNQAAQPPPAAPPAPDVSVGLLRPIWVDGTLLLARRVRVGEEQYVQGGWMDWPAIRKELLAAIPDLLPKADLVPVPAGAEARESRLLASLPVRLVPGEVPRAGGDGRSPLLASLALAWTCVLLAGAAVAALLMSAVALSERRAAFVSAVTHELRTPLTTLRMYAEMLAEGMIADQQKRQSYLGTMRAEADRLGHLIENVLAYSRLERGRARRQIETVSLGELIARIAPRLRERAAQAGMNLCVQDAPPEANVRVDVSAAEQIVFNLVDNACKYAAGAGDRGIHLQAAAPQGQPQIRVWDHGPGIPPAQQKALFRPFAKSAQQAANSAPGVGLGLALSRRLAREMGGDLQLVAAQAGGACFALLLPAAARD